MNTCYQRVSFQRPKDAEERERERRDSGTRREASGSIGSVQGVEWGSYVQKRSLDPAVSFTQTCGSGAPARGGGTPLLSECKQERRTSRNHNRKEGRKERRT